jgi:nucleoside-specific outer membrane channel protein Tsx
MKRQSLVFAALTLVSQPLCAANWSTTQFHLNHGNYKNPFSQQKASGYIYSLQHASAYNYGDNFFFVDYTKDDRSDGYQDGDYYAEWYSSVSLGKVTGREFKFGAIADVSMVMGLNVAGDAKVVKYLPGVKLHWNVPGFNFLSTSFTAYIDDSSGLTAQGAPSESNSWMFDMAWGYPFSIGDQRFMLTGHVEYIDGRSNELGNDVKGWWLAQPILAWDLGHALGNAANTLMLGIEWQYWRHKLGTGTIESAPQLHLEWTF